MASILHAFENLLSSILEIFRSLLNTVFSALESVAAIAGTSIDGVFDLLKGLFQFLLSNIVIIGVLIAAFVGYTTYQQRQGRAVDGSKKRT